MKLAVKLCFWWKADKPRSPDVTVQRRDEVAADAPLEHDLQEIRERLRSADPPALCRQCSVHQAALAKSSLASRSV